MAKPSKREAVALAIVQGLRNERIRQQLSMERVAEKAGLSQGMISLVERDLRSPTIDTLLRISEALDVNLGKIVLQAIEAAKKSARN